MMPRPDNESLPWYRYRWPWLLMLGPFTVLVAAAITLWIAIRSNDGLVADDYYKQGLAINQLTSREKRAAELALKAELSLEEGGSRVQVLLSGNQSDLLPEMLRLDIIHPTRSGLDQSLLLHADPAPLMSSSESEAAFRQALSSVRYSAPLGSALIGRWHITLEDGRREWRLVGIFETGKEPKEAFVLVMPPGS